jgi:hypothetical protein
MENVSGDQTSVWVYGKVTPGWYRAKGIWDEQYAKHLQDDLGYTVVRSIYAPTEIPQQS